MKARYTMKPRPADGGYEIMRDGKGGLLPTGERVTPIYERWRHLHDANTMLADAYLEGIVDGIKYEMSGGRQWLPQKNHC